MSGSLALERWLKLTKQHELEEALDSAAQDFLFTSSDEELRKPKARYQPSLGRLSLKFEPAGKVRVFAIVDYWTQAALKPLHHWMFDVLRVIPSDATFDQTGVLNRYASRGLKHHSGFDLTAATDMIPVGLYRELFKDRLGADHVDSWLDLLSDREFRLPRWNPDNKKGLGEPLYFEGNSEVRYTRGQPMGALSSWASLALVHHFLVYVAARRAGVSYPGKPFWDYLVLGDDLDLGDELVAKEYLDLTTSLGIPVNVLKSIISNQGAINFANRFMIGSTDLSPASLREEASINSFAKRMAFWARLRDRGWLVVGGKIGDNSALLAGNNLIDLFKSFRLAFHHRFWIKEQLSLTAGQVGLPLMRVVTRGLGLLIRNPNPSALNTLAQVLLAPKLKGLFAELGRGGELQGSRLHEVNHFLMKLTNELRLEIFVSLGVALGTVRSLVLERDQRVNLNLKASLASATTVTLACEKSEFRRVEETLLSIAAEHGLPPYEWGIKYDLEDRDTWAAQKCTGLSAEQTNSSYAEMVSGLLDSLKRVKACQPTSFALAIEGMITPSIFGDGSENIDEKLDALFERILVKARQSHSDWYVNLDEKFAQGEGRPNFWSHDFSGYKPITGKLEDHLPVGLQNFRMDPGAMMDSDFVRDLMAEAKAFSSKANKGGPVQPRDMHNRGPEASVGSGTKVGSVIHLPIPSEPFSVD
jgi:hypothetical protein